MMSPAPTISEILNSAKEKLSMQREEEIRRLARNYLMHARDLTGTKEEMSARAIKRATLVYDDVQAINIPVKP